MQLRDPHSSIYPIPGHPQLATMTPTAFATAPALGARAAAASPCARRSIAALSVAVAPPTLTPAVAPHVIPQRADAAHGGGPQSPGARSGRILLVCDGALRVADNAALVAGARAAASAGTGGALVPLAGLVRGAAGAAAELAAELQRRGSSLVAVRGDVVPAALDACKRLRLGAVYVNRALTRDVARMHRRLRAAANRAGLEFVVVGACGLVRDANEVPKELPKFAAQMQKNKTAAEPMDAPERLPSVPAQSSSIGVKDFLAKVGSGTSAALKVLNNMKKEGEVRRTKGRAQTSVLVREALNQGAVSEMMVAQLIVRKVGELKGATFEELVWRSFVAASYERMESVGPKAVVKA